MSLPLLLLGGVCGPLGAQGRGLDAQRETFFWSADAWRRIVGGAAYPASGCGARALGHVVAADRLLHVLRHVLQRALGLLVLTLGLAQIVGALTGARDPLRPLARLGAANSQGAAPVFTVIHSESDLAAAIQAAAGRPVVLDFYADWCVSCKEMDRFTFSDAAVAARLGAAVLLKADVTANTDAHRALLRRYKLFGPPGTLFFDAQGQEIAAARVLGFQNARRFAATLSSAGL